MELTRRMLPTSDTAMMCFGDYDDDDDEVCALAWRAL